MRPMTPVAEKLREVNRRKPLLRCFPNNWFKRRAMEHITLHSAHSGVRETPRFRQWKPRGLKYTNGVEFNSVVAPARQSRKPRLEEMQTVGGPQP